MHINKIYITVSFFKHMHKKANQNPIVNKFTHTHDINIRSY